MIQAARYGDKALFLRSVGVSAGILLFTAAAVTAAVLLPPLASVALVGSLAALVGAAFWAAIRGRDSLARGILWLGILAPLSVDQLKTQASVAALEITPQEIFRGVAPIACLILATLIRPIRLRPVTWPERILGVFLAVALLTSIWSISPTASLLKGVDLVATYALILLLVRHHAKAGNDSLRPLAGVVQVIVLVSFIEALVVPSLALTVLPFDPTQRLIGVFPAVASNLLALLAAAGVVLTLGGVVPRWLNPIPVRSAVILVDLLVLLLTRTRLELLLLLIAIIVMIALHVQRRPVILVGVALAGILAIGAAEALGSQLTDFLQRGQSQVQLSSLTGRTIVWGSATRLWLAHPIGGLGYYAGHRVGIVVGPGGPELSNIDNMWLETLVDTGILGTVPLAVLVTIAGAVLVRPHQKIDHATTVARRTLFLMCLLASFINPSLQAPSYAMFVFAIVIFGAPRIGLPKRAPHQAVDGGAQRPSEHIVGRQPAPAAR